MAKEIRELKQHTRKYLFNKKKALMKEQWTKKDKTHRTQLAKMADVILPYV